jgi:CubicO group peptidase (beta-lactamase class C family)
MKWPWLVLLTSVLVCTGASPAVAQADRVDSYVEKQRQEQKIPGIALGVYREGKLVKAQGYGWSNVELEVPVKPETLFQSGSVGKQFAATAILMLVEEGKLGLDDPIRKYFPDAPETWNEIKIRNLLSHTSGLSEYETEARTRPDGPFYTRLDLSEDELYKRIIAMPMDFKTGEDWSYRNTNYVLLGMLIRKLTGKFYGDYLQERIFQPLGMTTTRVISEADIIRNRASGYRLEKGQLKNQEWVSPTFNSTADGALYFTVYDLQKWDAALYTQKLLKKTSLDQMWTVAKLNSGQPNPGDYGFGWSIHKMNGHTLIEHGGAWQGFTCQIARYVDDKLTVVVLTNLDSAHSRPNKIAHDVAGLYVPALLPVEAKPIEDREPETTAKVRSLLESIAAGNVDQARATFSAELAGKFSAEDLKAMGGAFQEFGRLLSLDLLERKSEGEKRTSRYRLKYEHQELMLTVQLAPDGRFSSVRFSED